MGSDSKCGKIGRYSKYLDLSDQITKGVQEHGCVIYEKVAEYQKKGFHVGYHPELRQKVEGERQKHFKVAPFPGLTWPTSSAVQTLKRSSESQRGSSATLFTRL